MAENFNNHDGADRKSQKGSSAGNKFSDLCSEVWGPRKQEQPHQFEKDKNDSELQISTDRKGPPGIIDFSQHLVEMALENSIPQDKPHLAADVLGIQPAGKTEYERFAQLYGQVKQAEEASKTPPMDQSKDVAKDKNPDVSRLIDKIERSKNEGIREKLLSTVTCLNIRDAVKFLQGRPENGTGIVREDDPGWKQYIKGVVQKVYDGGYGPFIQRVAQALREKFHEGKNISDAATGAVEEAAKSSRERLMSPDELKVRAQKNPEAGVWKQISDVVTDPDEKSNVLAQATFRLEAQSIDKDVARFTEMGRSGELQTSMTGAVGARAQSFLIADIEKAQAERMLGSSEHRLSKSPDTARDSVRHTSGTEPVEQVPSPGPTETQVGVVHDAGAENRQPTNSIIPLSISLLPYQEAPPLSVGAARKDLSHTPSSLSDGVNQLPETIKSPFDSPLIVIQPAVDSSHFLAGAYGNTTVSDLSSLVETTKSSEKRDRGGGPQTADHPVAPTAASDRQRIAPVEHPVEHPVAGDSRLEKPAETVRPGIREAHERLEHWADKRLQDIEEHLKQRPIDNEKRLHLQGKKTTLEQFKKDLRTFENRPVSDRINNSDRLTDKEVNATLNQMARLPLGKGRAPIGSEDRIQVMMQLMHQAANPQLIDQRGYNTCSVAALESKTYNSNPSKAVKLVADVCLDGSYTFEGTDPKDSHTRRQFTVDLSPEKHRDSKNFPTPDGQRSYASEIFQVVAVNVYYQIHESNKIYKQTDSGEQLVFKNGEAVKDDSGHPIREPYLSIESYSEINSAITGKDEGADVVIANRDTISRKVDEKRVTLIGSQKELEAKLETLNKDGKLPIMLRVNTNCDPFYLDSGRGKFGQDGELHEVTIIGYDPVSRMVYVDNQWGSAKDHGAENPVPIVDLYIATQTTGDAIGSLVHVIEGAHGPVPLKQMELARLKLTEFADDFEWQRKTHDILRAEEKRWPMLSKDAQDREQQVLIGLINHMPVEDRIDLLRQCYEHKMIDVKILSEQLIEAGVKSEIGNRRGNLAVWPLNSIAHNQYEREQIQLARALENMHDDLEKIRIQRMIKKRSGAHE